MAQHYDPASPAAAGGAAAGGGMTAIMVAVVALLGLLGLGGLYYAGTLDKMFGRGPYAAAVDPNAPDTNRPRGLSAPATTSAATAPAAPAETPAAPPVETAAAPVESRWVDGRWCAADGVALTFTPGSWGIQVEGDAYAGAVGYQINGDNVLIMGPREGDENIVLAQFDRDGDSGAVASDEGGQNRRVFSRC